MLKAVILTGTQLGSTSSFEHEMSQEGFSAAITSVSALSLNWGHTKREEVPGFGTLLCYGFV
jgi:hypothetical protein